MATLFIWRVFDTVLQDYFDIISATEPTDHDGNAINTVRTAIRSSIGPTESGFRAELHQGSSRYIPFDGVDFRMIASWRYAGSTEWTPQLFRIVAQTDALVLSPEGTAPPTTAPTTAPPSEYEFRIFDLDNQNTIATIQTTLTSRKEVFETTDLNNVPVNEAILELHARSLVADSPVGRVNYVELV